MEMKSNMVYKKKAFKILRQYWARKRAIRKKLNVFAPRKAHLDKKFYFNALKLAIRMDYLKYE